LVKKPALRKAFEKLHKDKKVIGRPSIRHGKKVKIFIEVLPNQIIKY